MHNTIVLTDAAAKTDSWHRSHQPNKLPKAGQEAGQKSTVPEKYHLAYEGLLQVPRVLQPGQKLDDPEQPAFRRISRNY